MTKWRTSDGELFEAESPEQLYQLLRSSSKARDPNGLVWRRNAAERIEKQFGRIIRYSHIQDFIHDLEEVGAIRREK
jgi:hypothetical protein